MSILEKLDSFFRDVVSHTQNYQETGFLAKDSHYLNERLYLQGLVGFVDEINELIELEQ